MTALPIVERELRVATRRRNTYWSRVVAALVAIGLVVWMLGTFGKVVAPELLGARIFKALSGVAFFCCLFPGVVLTADCLSEEKRAGTLGLLFLTDLKGYDVVLGKLIVTSLRSFYGLLAIFPLMALPFFLGGVTPGEFWRMLAVLVNTLFFSLAVGMLFSSICWQGQRAMLGTAALIVLSAFALPSLGSVGRFFSPQNPFRLAYAGAFQQEPLTFALSWLWLQLSAWILLLLSSRFVLESWQKKELGLDQKPEQASQPFWRRTRLNYSGSNPVEWLGRVGQKNGLIWLSLFLPAVIWLVGYARHGAAWWSPLSIFLGVAGWHAVLQFWITWESSRSLNEARRSGTLEQVLSTPLSTKDIVDGLMRALERQFIPMLMVLLGLDILLLLVLMQSFGLKGDASAGVFAVFLGFIATSALQCYVLAWLGLWLGLKLTKAEQAAIRAMLWGTALPSGLFMVAIYVLLGGGTFGSPTFFMGCSGSWVMIGGATGYLLYIRAQNNLLTQFRHTAALYTDKPPPRPATTEKDWNEDFGLLRETNDQVTGH